MATEQGVGAYIRVDGVFSPGHFVLGSDMQSPLTETLPNGNPKSGYVIGQNPMLDYQLSRYLKLNLPVKQISRELIKNGGLVTLVLFPNPWQGQSGLLKIDSEFAQLIQSHSTNGNPENTIKIVDQGEPIIKNDDYHIPKSEDTDGIFVLTIDTCHSNEPDNISYWRGRLRLSGHKPGKLIVASIDYLNREIKERGIPVWQATGYQSEPKIHPYWPF